MTETIVFMIPGLYGGGAEQIIALLANNFSELGYKVFLLLTRQKVADSQSFRMKIDENITVFSLEDGEIKIPPHKKLERGALHLFGKLHGVFAHQGSNPFMDTVRIARYAEKNYESIYRLRGFLRSVNHCTIVAFLDQAIHYAMLAKKSQDTLIISERGDPQQHNDDVTSLAFIHRYYEKANGMVFQTHDAQQYYSKVIQDKSVIIPNPVKGDLPQPYFGKRKKIITNFCRISDQKNLPLLIRAFALFHVQFPEYKLQIIGNISEDSSKKIMTDLKCLAHGLEIDNCVEFLNFQNNVHSVILEYAMFVSSSDYEGMSNSMLEAMAIGLPTICTNCPAGGAEEVIRDGVNGLLIPMNDAAKMCEAMVKIASDEKFAAQLSAESQKLRTILCEENIVRQWDEFVKKVRSNTLCAKSV